jgi:hypothetical protein
MRNATRASRKRPWGGDFDGAYELLSEFVRGKPDSYYGYIRNLLRNPDSYHHSRVDIMNMATVIRDKHPEMYRLWLARRRVLGLSIPKGETT